MEVIVFLAILGLIITYLIHAELYFRKLRQSAPDIYSELGHPSVIGKKQNPLPILQFFISKQYQQLEDTSLVRMADRLVIHFVLILICMITFFGYMVWFGQF